MSLPVVILAGGLGTRLGDLTRAIPKALIEVNGEPFLARQMRLLRQNGIDKVVMCIGHKGDLIQQFLGDGSAFDMQVQYSFDGPVLLGTAGAIRQACPLLADSFFVLYGDSYLPCDYQRIAAHFEHSGKDALMTVFRNEGAWDTSNVEFMDGRILVYDKVNRTPRMHYIDYGLGVFRRDVFLALPPATPYDLARVYAERLAADQLAAFEIKERFYEIGRASCRERV